MPRVRLDGGIIGSLNTPTTSVASGIWTVKDNEEYTRRGLWPSQGYPIGAINVAVLIVAGGGGGGASWGGGGGAGSITYNSNYILPTGINYPIIIGAGGAASSTNGVKGSNGTSSSFYTLSSTGGGGGGSWDGASAYPQTTGGFIGNQGASGGGSSSKGSIGGANTLGLGYAGGAGLSDNNSYDSGGGGGGAGGIGATATGGTGAAGGTGVAYNITGTSIYYAGGGGGGSTGSGGAGGTGGGGAGGGTNSTPGTSANTGQGGGGGGGSVNAGQSGGAGGSGTVIISYPLPQQFTGGKVTNNNGTNVVHTFTTSANLVALATPIDIYQPYNSLLLHADGANGINNSGFVDSVIGANTNIPFNSTYSYYFNGGTSDLLTSSASGSFYQLTGDFTIECWFKLSSLSSGGLITLTQTVAGNSTSGLSLYITSSGAVSFFVNGNQGATNSANGLVSINTWYHIALVRIGSTNTAYLNGVSVVSNSTTPTWGTTFVGLGRVYVDNSGGLLGYISNVRIIKGQGLYTGAFTPGTSQLTANTVGTSGANVASSISGSVMALTGMSPSYSDFSSNAINFVVSGTVGITNGSNTAVAKTGTPTQGTFSPFSTTGWSNYFTSTSDTFTSAVSSNFAFAGTFTIEFWIYLTSVPTTNVQLVGIASVGGISVYYNSSGFISANLYGTGDIFASTYTFTGNLNTWHHVVLSRGSGNTMRIWVDGVSYGSGTSTTSFTATTGFKEGGSIAGAYISNLRVNNTDVYGVTNSIITVPSIPLSAITGTQLLINQSNRYIDNSTNNLALTIAGSPQVQPFSPFNPTAAYSNTVVGGSMYFNGTTDYLVLPLISSFAIGTGDFTVEAWVYPTGNYGFYSSIIAGINYGLSSDWGLYAGGQNASTGNAPFFQFTNSTTDRLFANTPLTGNTWNHVAVTRQSGTARIFLNGVQSNSGTFSTQSLNNTLQKGIGGGYNGNASTLFPGYISNLRVANSAIYTANFTPSTTPLTATANTVLLLNATNASIIDSSQKVNLISYGSAAISTTQSKFGGTSMYFDGSTGYLSNPSSTAFTFGPGDFTVEYWVYYNAISGSSYQQICGGSSTSAGFSFGLSSTPKLYMTTSSVGYTSTGTTLVTGQWYHVAFVRKSGTVYFYLNGVLDYSVSAATTITETGFGIGGSKTGAYFSSCYVDELRVTQGYARYTSNFTPPTTAFLNT